MAWNDIPGRAAYLWLYDELLDRVEADPLRVFRVAEVGVALGKSIAYLVTEAQRRNLDKRIQVFAVDAWGGFARNGEQQALSTPDKDYELFMAMMQDNAPDVLPRVNIIRHLSVDGARLFEDRSFDLVVLDADHTFQAVRDDIAAWEPKVKFGGVIGGDDWVPDFPGVEQAVKERFLGVRDIDIRIDHEHKWGSWRVRL